MKAVLTKVEHKKLLRQNEGDADVISDCSSFFGPKVEIDLNKLEAQEGQLENGSLLDTLGTKICRTREEQFLSYFFQMREVLCLPRQKAGSVLEIGNGQGFFKALSGCYGQHVLTVDINPEAKPDVLGDVLALPFSTASFDCVCAFQVLEHLPFEFFPQAIEEMKRCCRHYVFLNLPCHMNSFYFQMRLRLLQRFWSWASYDVRLLCPLPVRSKDYNERLLLQRKDWRSPHYWELNRRTFPKRRILDVLENEGLKIKRQFHNPYYPYHFFILAEVRAA